MGSEIAARSPVVEWWLDLFKVSFAGLATGLITPWLQPVIDRIPVPPGGFRVALLALPFAVLVAALVWRRGRRWWTALPAALIVMIAFVCAVNTAILADSLAFDLGSPMRHVVAGLAGGFVGTTMMALGLLPLPGVPFANWGAWLSMLVVGTLAGALLALDNAVGFEFFSYLYPVWQCGVGVCLSLALQRR